MDVRLRRIQDSESFGQPIFLDNSDYQSMVHAIYPCISDSKSLAPSTVHNRQPSHKLDSQLMEPPIRHRFPDPNLPVWQHSHRVPLFLRRLTILPVCCFVFFHCNKNCSQLYNKSDRTVSYLVLVSGIVGGSSSSQSTGLLASGSLIFSRSSHSAGLTSVTSSISLSGLTGGVKSVNSEPVKFWNRLELPIWFLLRLIVFTFVYDFVIDTNRICVVRSHNQLVQMGLFIFEWLFDTFPICHRTEKNRFQLQNQKANYALSLSLMLTLVCDNVSPWLIR